jgi:high-affinity iron transporter
MIDTSPQGLAGMTDEDLLAETAAFAEPAMRFDALAYFRALAPFEKPSAEAVAAQDADAYGRARHELRAGAEAHSRGDIGAAKTHFVAAYLDGFEPLEAVLAARDPQLVRDVERELLELREHAGDPNARAEVSARVARIEGLLDRASGRDEGGDAAFYGAFAITLREGLEAVLLAGALLLLVRKRERPELARYVHAGWAVAIALGFVTFFAASEVLSGMQRELAEGIAALLAAAVLLGVTHWLLGQSTAQRFMGFLAQRLERAVRGQNAAWGVFGLSFIAVYREAFEVVLFFQALLLEAGSAPEQVWLGAAVGLGVLLAVALLLRVIGQRLRPRPLMLASSVLLAILSFSLAGKGVRSLQEAAVLPLHAVGTFELPLLGIYASREGLLVQGMLLLALLGSALTPWLAARGPAEAP